jgi:hypothetical protein
MLKVYLKPSAKGKQTWTLRHHHGIEHVPVNAAIASLDQDIFIAIVDHRRPTLIGSDETELPGPGDLLDESPGLTAIRGLVNLAAKGKTVLRVKER